METMENLVNLINTIDNNKEAISNPLFIPIIIGLVIIPLAYEYLFIRHTTIKVQEKTIKVNSYSSNKTHSSTSSYMVFTTNGQAFKNTNTFFFFKFNCDEIQAQLKVNKTYRIKTSGLRVPFLGLFKNIIKVEEIKQKK